MMDCVQKLLADGVSPISVNTYLRGFKAYIRWMHEEGKLEQVFKVQFLKTEQKVLATFSSEQVKRLINWKPVGRNKTRVRIMALTALDTGVRVNELLCLTRKDVNLDALTLLVHGKGNKERLVPMSIELRKVLYRHLAGHQHELVFCTKQGGQLTQRNVLRDFKVVCESVGISGVRCSMHTLRHSFAVGYLRAGGNLFYLSKILGHTSVKTTEKYLQSLGIEDFKVEHSRLSLLANGR